jgi:hypothetical protein
MAGKVRAVSILDLSGFVRRVFGPQNNPDTDTAFKVRVKTWCGVGKEKSSLVQPCRCLQSGRAFSASLVGVRGSSLLALTSKSRRNLS